MEEGKHLRLADAGGQVARVACVPLPKPAGPTLGWGGGAVRFRRWLACTEAGQDAALQQRLGAPYGEALVAGDPEVDMEQVGRFIGATQTVYLASSGARMDAAPTWVEVVLDPAGEEVARGLPQVIAPNVTDDVPLRWTGQRLPRGQAARRYAFSRTLQVAHVDATSYELLYAMAKELDARDEVVLVGAGDEGREALVLRPDGVPWCAFLEGRVDGERYQLLLHLSAMELVQPFVGGEEGRARPWPPLGAARAPAASGADHAEEKPQGLLAYWDPPAVGARLEEESAPPTAKTLPPAELLRREVYTKSSRGLLAVRKLLVWCTHKAEVDRDFPAYVVHWTDYSPGRKEPLQRTVRPAPTEAEALALAEGLVAKEIVKGWVKS